MNNLINQFRVGQIWIKNYLPVIVEFVFCIAIKVTDPPNPDILESAEMKDVYSLTPFVTVQTENHVGPKQETHIQLPLPEEYGVGGSIKVFTSNVYEIDDISENSWTLLDTRCTVSKNVISFDARSFSL